MNLFNVSLFQGRRWWRPIAAMAIAFVIVARLSAPAAALPSDSDRWLDAIVDMYADYCSSLGGVASVHYEFNADGTVWGVFLTCSAGIMDVNFTCDFWDDETWNCTGVFAPEKETAVGGTRAVEGGIVGAHAGENPISTPTVVLNADEGVKVTTRPAPTPKSEPVEETETRR